MVGYAKEEKEGGKGKALVRENRCQETLGTGRSCGKGGGNVFVPVPGLQLASEGGGSCGFPHCDPGYTDLTQQWC